MTDKYHRVIGIDLGTTYSAVSVYNRYEEETEIISNPESVDNQGRARPETTPSVISLDPLTRRTIVGWPAKRNVADTENTIIEIKREMGEVFREETLDRFRARNVFRAREEREGGYEGDPVKVQFMGEWHLPQEISAFTLMKMKQVAEAHIGVTIHDAVITVPAYFTERQKKATEEAAYLAGLYPRQLIPEPTAAAICYGVDRLEQKRKVYLVYDLGGGTFDVSIISVEESQISVLATSGDPRLGGGDFDDAIVDWAIAELWQNFQLEVGNDPEKRARIKAHAEQAKKELATLNSATLTLIDVWPQQPPSLVLTREKLEELIQPLLRKSLTYVDAALKQAYDNRGLRREDLDAILLVGGSTKIPRCRSMLLAHFQQDESFVSAGLNPDEVVARGAATVGLKFAASQGDFDIANRPDNSLVNPDMDDELGIDLITEHSLGIGIQNSLISRIIDQGTSIPVSRRQGGFTNASPTNYLDVPVYQGEGEYTYQNTLIGTLRIGPMEPRPEGTHQFEVTFSLDDNGLLAMTVHHINEGKNYQAQFDQKTGVGGAEALTARRAKLLKLYGDQPATIQPTFPPPAQPVAPPSPAGASSSPVPNPAAAGASDAHPAAPGYGAPQQPAPEPTPTQPAQMPSQPAAGQPYPGRTVPAQPYPGSPQPFPGQAASGPPTPGQTAAPGQPAPSTAAPGQVASGQPVSAATAGDGYASYAPPAGPVSVPDATAPASTQILEPTGEVPAEFKSIVRRSHKLLLNEGPPQLREAFNEFVRLLNSGAPADTIEEAGDELADVYQDCR